MSRILDPQILDSQIPRFLDFQISRYYILDIYGSRCTTCMYQGLEDTAVDADADADEDYVEEGEVLEADAELQKQRKTEDAVAVMNVAEDVRMDLSG